MNADICCNTEPLKRHNCGGLGGYTRQKHLRTKLSCFPILDAIFAAAYRVSFGLLKESLKWFFWRYITGMTSLVKRILDMHRILTTLWKDEWCCYNTSIFFCFCLFKYKKLEINRKYWRVNIYDYLGFGDKKVLSRPIWKMCTFRTKKSSDAHA